MSDMSQSEDSLPFCMEGRGKQDFAWADVKMVEGRATITIESLYRFHLTRIQTEELAKWMLERFAE